MPGMTAATRAGAVAAAVLMLAAGVAAAPGEGKPMPVRGFRYPMELYEDGSIKTQIIAEQLTGNPESGNIEARRARVEFYEPNGALATVIEVDTCMYDKDKGVATSKSNVRLERGGVVITGKGMEWDAGQQRVRVLTEAKVVLDRDLHARRRRDAPGIEAREAKERE